MLYDAFFQTLRVGNDMCIRGWIVKPNTVDVILHRNGQTIPSTNIHTNIMDVLLFLLPFHRLPSMWTHEDTGRSHQNNPRARIIISIAVSSLLMCIYTAAAHTRKCIRGKNPTSVSLRASQTWNAVCRSLHGTFKNEKRSLVSYGWPSIQHSSSTSVVQSYLASMSSSTWKTASVATSGIGCCGQMKAEPANRRAVRLFSLSSTDIGKGKCVVRSGLDGCI